MNCRHCRRFNVQTLRCLEFKLAVTTFIQKICTTRGKNKRKTIKKRYEIAILISLFHWFFDQNKLLILIGGVTFDLSVELMYVTDTNGYFINFFLQSFFSGLTGDTSNFVFANFLYHETAKK